jgi:hypothetical protein
MGLLVSTDLTWDPVCAFGGPRMVLRIIDYQFSLLVGPVGMWGKASISPLFELARETGEAGPVGAADRPHIHRPFLPTVPRRDQSFWVMIRGSSPSDAEHRATHLYSVDSMRIQTMMQSCASAAKLRDGRPIL